MPGTEWSRKYSRRKRKPSGSVKNITSEYVSKRVEEYLANGGKITTLPPGGNGADTNPAGADCKNSYYGRFNT